MYMMCGDLTENRAVDPVTVLHWEYPQHHLNCKRCFGSGRRCSAYPFYFRQIYARKPEGRPLEWAAVIFQSVGYTIVSYCLSLSQSSMSSYEAT